MSERERDGKKPEEELRELREKRFIHFLVLFVTKSDDAFLFHSFSLDSEPLVWLIQLNPTSELLCSRYWIRVNSELLFAKFNPSYSFKTSFFARFPNSLCAHDTDFIQFNMLMLI